MENLLYIAALIFALAFVALVIYIIRVLKETERTMANVASTLDGLEQQMNGITTETTLLLSRTNDLAEDINQKSQRVNQVVDSIGGLGTTITDFNRSLQHVSDAIIDKASENHEEAAQVIKWGTVIMELYNKRKSKKKQ